MLKKVAKWNWMVLCLVTLATVASCQAGSPLDPSDEAANINGNTEVTENIVTQPVLPKEGSGIWDLIDDYVIDFSDLLFNLKHQSLVTGNNDIDHMKTVLRSNNVVESTHYSKPKIVPDGNGGWEIQIDQLESIELHSTFEDMSFVTYGFKDIPVGQQITKIKVEGYLANPLFNPSGGLYIGVSDYGKSTYRWYGPLGTEDEYEVNLYKVDTTNSDQRAYVTLAVFGSDAIGITKVEIEVGEPKMLPIGELPFDFLEVIPFP